MLSLRDVCKRTVGSAAASEEHLAAVNTMMMGLSIQPRWPEMITFEECNIPTPDHVAAWIAHLENHPAPEIRAMTIEKRRHS